MTAASAPSMTEEAGDRMFGPGWRNAPPVGRAITRIVGSEKAGSPMVTAPTSAVTPIISPSWPTYIARASGHWKVDRLRRRRRLARRPRRRPGHPKRPAEVPRALFRSLASMGRAGAEREARNEWAKRGEAGRRLPGQSSPGHPGVVVRARRPRLSAPVAVERPGSTVGLSRTGDLGRHDPTPPHQAPRRLRPDAAAPVAAVLVRRGGGPRRPHPPTALVGSSPPPVLPVEVVANVGGGITAKASSGGADAPPLGPRLHCRASEELMISPSTATSTTVTRPTVRRRVAVAAETEGRRHSSTSEVKGSPAATSSGPTHERGPVAVRAVAPAVPAPEPPSRGAGTDEGIWRRLQLIPWNVTIPPGERDLHTSPQARRRGPGIQTAGSSTGPASGTTTAWRSLTPSPEPPPSTAPQGRTTSAASPVLGLDPAASITAGDLRALYERWCNDTGEDAMPPRPSAANSQAEASPPDKSAVPAPEPGSGIRGWAETVHRLLPHENRFLQLPETWRSTSVSPGQLGRHVHRPAPTDDRASQAACAEQVLALAAP